MEPSQLKSEMHVCTWIFDFFAIGFDYLASRIFPSEDILEDLARMSDPAFRKTISDEDGAIPASIHEFLGLRDGGWTNMKDADLKTDDFLLKLLYVLWQIDRAALDLNYFCFFAKKLHWPTVADHLDVKNCLNRDPARKVIIRPPELSKKKWWVAASKLNWNRAERGQHLEPFFKNLIRVPELLGANIDIVRRSVARLGAIAVEEDILKIGVAPLIQDIRNRGDFAAELVPGPLHIVPRRVISFARVSKSRRISSRFGIDVIEGDGTQTMEFLARRAAVATQSACDNGVHLLLFPELVVPDEVVAAIRKVLHENFLRGAKTPSITLAGTFGRPSTDGKRYNEAVLLDGSGRVLSRQRKMHAYKMFTYEQKKYDLIDLFQNVPREEDFDVFPRRIEFVDSSQAGYRIVTLICEDAAQENPGREAVAAMHPTVIFVPVMAGALQRGCWCWNTAEVFASRPGAVAIVANSGGLAKAHFTKLGRKEAPPLAILGAPLADPEYNQVRSAFAADRHGLLMLGIP